MIFVAAWPSIDGDFFNLGEFGGPGWFLVPAEGPLTESRRDELLESFQATYHGGDGRAVSEAAIEDGEEPDLEEDEA